MLEFLTDNIYVEVGGHIYQHIIGITIGTNCAHLLFRSFRIRLRGWVYTNLYERQNIIIKEAHLHECIILLWGFHSGVKLVLSTQTYHVSKMMRSCRCFPHASKMPTLTYNRVYIVIIQNAMIFNIIHSTYSNVSSVAPNKANSHEILLSGVQHPQPYLDLNFGLLNCQNDLND
jgi:hypothetical protein